MSEKVRAELTADVKTATEPKETRWHLGRWSVAGAAGVLAVAFGGPALVRATEPDCSVVMRVDEPGIQAIYLPDGRRRYGDAFSTDEGMRVLLGSTPLGGGDSIEFDQRQIAEGTTAEYDAGNGVMLHLRVNGNGEIETSC